jgi:predicted enzyme related to lactoylglutathione lyase
MNEKVNILNWFEIPVKNMERATKFYEAVFSVKMEQSESMGMKMAFFPMEDMNGKVSGGLVEGPMHTPSMDGAVIYLNANPDLSVALGRVEKSGGKVLMNKTLISDEIGYMAFFTDTEGNRVAMHSNK